MKNTGAILAVLLTVFLCLSVSVVYAQEHTETSCRISNVDLNGQGIDLTVAPGETIKLSFDYEVWSPSPLPISAQQLVIGLEREPLFCAYSGSPGAIPNSIKKGHSQFTMTAPTKLGTYVIRWMTIFEPTCNYAKNAYRNSVSLGYGMAEITVAEPDKQGICGRVYNVNLNNQGNYLEVCTNEAFTVDLDYDIWCWVSGNSRRQIMIGIDDDPFWCVYNGVPPEYPGLSRHDSVTIAIPKPGTYTLSWMITFCDNVGDAGDRFRSRPDLREKIGTIKVTDCSGGIYDRYCEVFAISLNGQDNLEIGPGGLVRITVYYELWNADTCPECTQQIVIGLDDNPMYCAYDGVPGIHPGIYDHDQVFYEMTAPTTPGIYNIMWTSTSGCTCAEAKNLYRTGPNFRKKIATITVIADEEWRCIHYKVVQFPDNPRVHDSNISFWQQGHNLRVFVNVTPGTGIGGTIGTGAVSISVDEDIHVFYNSTNVMGLEDYYLCDKVGICYKEINPSNIRDSETLFLIFGSIPYAGLGFSILDYSDGSEKYLKCDWYEENDTIGNKITLTNFFDYPNMQNSHDIIFIPWYLDFGFSSVDSLRVDCPSMLFPQNVHTCDMVFRVEYRIGPRYSALGGKKVRYDVALPITVS